jgi:hypothetical protein
MRIPAHLILCAHAPDLGEQTLQDQESGLKIKMIRLMSLLHKNARSCRVQALKALLQLPLRYGKFYLALLIFVCLNV